MPLDKCTESHRAQIRCNSRPDPCHHFTNIASVKALHRSLNQEQGRSGSVPTMFTHRGLIPHPLKAMGAFPPTSVWAGWGFKVVTALKWCSTKSILCQDVALSVSIAAVYFLKIGNNNLIEPWPTVLAQPEQTRWSCSSKGLWNIKHKRGHATTASPSLPWLHKLQPAASLCECVLLDNCSDLHQANYGSILLSSGCCCTTTKLRSCLRFHLLIERPPRVWLTSWVGSTIFQRPVCWRNMLKES